MNGYRDVRFAITPDGRRLLLFNDKRLKFIDFVSGETVHSLQLDSNEGRSVHSVAISADGHWAAMQGFSLTALVDIGGKDPKAERSLSKPFGCGDIVAFSPDGRYFLAGGEKWTLQMYETATGTPVRRFDPVDGVAAKQCENVSAAFSPDGKLLATAVDSVATVRLWDVSTGSLAGTFEGPADANIKQIAFAPDGKTIAAVSTAAFAVAIWNVTSGKIVMRDGLDSVGGGFSIAYSPDGRKLAVGARLIVRLWDIASGKLELLRDFKASRYNANVNQVAFTPDGRWIVASVGDDLIPLPIRASSAATAPSP